MTVGREQRMAELRPRIEAEFGKALLPRVVDVLTLTELAWHDCHGEPAPPRGVVDDILVVADGDLKRLIQAALLAVVDSRDLRMSADEQRQGRARP